MPVTGMSLFYLNGILEDVISITQIDARLLEEAETLRSHLREAGEAESAFLLFREDHDLEQNRAAMDEVQRTILEEAGHLGPGMEELVRIPELASLYRVTMTRLADLYTGPAGAEQPLAAFDRTVGLLQTRLRSLRDQAAAERNPAARRLLHEEIRQAVRSMSEELIENVRRQDPDRARLLDELARLRERIDAIAESVQKRAEAHITEHRQHVISLSNRARRNILTMVSITGMVGIYLILFLPARVVRTLRRITHVVQQAERGDLDVSALETGSDEVGMLASHLNRLIRQVRTFDELKTERMLRAERRLDALVENLEEGVVLVDDELHPVYVSRRARQLLDARPEGADDSRVSTILAEREISGLVREALDTQTGQGSRLLTLDVGGREPRRLRAYADPLVGENGEIREILLLLRKAA
jgi:methyl-accepting chemotaxis protein